MAGRNRQRVTQRQFVKFGSDHFAAHAFGLVDHQKHRAAALAQAIGDDFVLRSAAGAHVHHEQNHVGFVDGLQGLACHFVHDAVFDDRFKTAGIDHQKGLFADFAVTVMAVAGEAGNIRNDGVAGFGQAVEQGGFAHIGAAYQYERGFHDV